jgi:hypothetical protein
MGGGGEASKVVLTNPAALVDQLGDQLVQLGLWSLRKGEPK